MLNDLNGLKTLILNADFRPLNRYPLSYCTWQEAVKALVTDRVHVVSEYDHAVHSPSTSIRVPSVVCLKEYVKEPAQEPALTRQNIFIRDLYTCQYCGEEHAGRYLTLDHVIPRSRGGDSSWTNLVAACKSCNSRKSDKIPGKEFAHPLQKPFVPTAYQLQSRSRQMMAEHLPESWKDFLS